MLVNRLTYDPSSPISAHVTVDLKWLALISTQIDGVQAGGSVTIE